MYFETCLLQIKGIQEQVEKGEKYIWEKFKTDHENLRRDGAHEDEFRQLVERRDGSIRTIKNAADVLFLTYKVSDLVPSALGCGYEVTVGKREMVLLKLPETNIAFLLHLRCRYAVTSYGIVIGGLRFGFICGCENCNRGVERKELQTVVREIAKVATQHGIENVVMRHNSNWPQGPARDFGVFLREIKGSKYDEQLRELIKQLKSL